MKNLLSFQINEEIEQRKYERDKKKDRKCNRIKYFTKKGKSVYERKRGEERLIEERKERQREWKKMEDL